MSKTGAADAVARVEQAFASSWFHIDEANAPRVAIAVSGGLDSMVLMHLCARAGVAQRVFHVDHGLQDMSAQWEKFVRESASILAFDFSSAKLNIAKAELKKEGLEASAREHRYASLLTIFSKTDFEKRDLLALAHHQSDQAETFLLQALRGAGAKGLSAMAELSVQENMRLWRPLLNCSKSDLQAYAKSFELKHIEDPSNASTKYRRNALRNEVMPLLEQNFPGYEKALARSAFLAQDAQRMLDQICKEDLRNCETSGYSLRLETLMRLDESRLANVLRYWLTTRLNVRAMSQARLSNFCAILKSALGNPPARGAVLVTHEGWVFTCTRGVVAASKSAQAQVLSSFSKAELLRIDQLAKGLGGRIEWRAPLGKDRFQRRINASHTRMKNVFQAANVPLNQRREPVAVFVPDDALRGTSEPSEVAYVPCLGSFGARFRPA